MFINIISMQYKRLALSIVPLLFIFASISQNVWAAGEENIPIKNAQQSIFEENRSLMFILNEDSTISAYDAAGKNFIFIRRPLPGVQDARQIIIGPKGSFIGIRSFIAGFTSIKIFNIDTIISGEDIIPSASYLIENEDVGGVLLEKFSDDEKSLFLVANNNVFVLSSMGDMTQNNVFQSGEKREEKIAVGDIPIIIDMDSSGHLFILNQKSESVSIVDLSKKTVAATVRVGSFPKNLIFNTATKKIYVSHIGSDDIYVIDPQSASVIKKIAIGGDPVSLAYDKTTGDVFTASNSSGVISIISPDFQVRGVDLKSPAYLTSTPLTLWYMQRGHLLFVLNRSVATLFAYDTAASRIVNEQKTNLFPTNIMGSEKLNSLFVTHSNADSFSRVDARTFTAAQIPEHITTDELFFSRPQSIAIDEDRNRIFISNLDNNIIAVIDGNTQQPIAKIRSVNAPQVISFNPATGKLYATSPVDNEVAVVDTLKEDYPVKIIPVGKQPRVLYINKVTNRIYVSHAGDSTVHVIDGATDTDIRTIVLPAKSFPLLIQGDEAANRVYVNLYGKGEITVIDGTTDTIETHIPVGQNPIWLRPIPSAHRLIVSVEGERKIAIIDTDTNKIIQTVELSGVPYRIFFDERTSYIYVNFRRENKVAIITPDTSFSTFTLLQEIEMPYWGQTDARPYNMALINSKTNFAYFTNGRDNKVVVIKDELDDKGIKKPVYYATILADGFVNFAPQAAPSSTGINIYFYVISGGILLLLMMAYGAVRKRMSGSV